MELHFDGN